MKGEYAPTRGTYLTLNRSTAILSLTGAKEVKKPTDGMPYPVLLHLHRYSTFTDMKYLTEQVYTFASHSWKSFDMAGMPGNDRIFATYRPSVRQIGGVASLQCGFSPWATQST